MRMLADYIAYNARRYPQQVAIVCGQEQCTWQQLAAAISRTAPLPDSQTPRLPDSQPIVCLRAACSIDFIVTYFALHLSGCVAVPLDKNLDDGQFRRFSDELRSQTVPPGSADILYTTGTTGQPKGVVISHQAILADAENLIEGHGYCHQLAFVINGPLNHIGSLSKLYPAIMVGATVILVDGLKDINRFLESFNYPAAKMATFLVPAGIRILLHFSADRLAALADRLDFIETGAAAIPQSDMQMLCRLLPHTRLYNTYASTETGIICTYNFNDGRCIAGCVGRPMKHSQVTITPDGTVACMGPTLMTGYVGSTSQPPKLPDAQLTSDIGRIDDEGMLHLLGRNDDIINVGGLKVAPTEVEDAALSFPDVRDCVCLPVPHPVTGQALKLLVVMADGRQLDRKALATFLKSRLESHKVPLLYEQTEKIERTFNGKINRKYYKSQ